MILNENELEILHKLYYEDKLSLKKIAKEMHRGDKTISACLKELCWSRDAIGNAFKDETGNTYNYLTVIKPLKETNSDGKKYFLCQCVCGREIKVIGKELRNGHVKSCGCRKSER